MGDLVNKERQNQVIKANLKQAFLALDTDGSTDLTKEEVNSRIRGSEEARSALTLLELDDVGDLFDKLDLNSDGPMAIEEFVEGVIS